MAFYLTSKFHSRTSFIVLIGMFLSNATAIFSNTKNTCEKVGGMFLSSWWCFKMCFVSDAVLVNDGSIPLSFLFGHLTLVFLWFL